MSVQELDPARSYSAILETSHGTFTVALATEISPQTTASFVSLARDGFYDGTPFHRIVPGFVIQGGDPTGTGTGGPGYKTVDTPPESTRYTRGLVAMAKTMAEPAGTAGSQFFVVTGEDVGLPADYAVLGQVVEGDDVVERIGQLGDFREQPTEPVTLTTVRIEEGDKS